MKKRSRESSAIDMTPLIDVVFTLLAFFMVSTVFKKDELALLLSLPKTSTGESKQEQRERVTIELGVEKVAYNGQETTIENLASSLKTISNKLTPIELRIDKEVRYERVINLLDQLKTFELTNINLITEK